MRDVGELLGLLAIGAGLLGDVAVVWTGQGRSARRRARGSIGDFTVAAALCVLGVRGVLRGPGAPLVDVLVALVGLVIGGVMLWAAVRSLEALAADRRHRGHRTAGALRFVAWLWLAVLVAYEAARRPW